MLGNSVGGSSSYRRSETLEAGKWFLGWRRGKRNMVHRCGVEGLCVIRLMVCGVWCTDANLANFFVGTFHATAFWKDPLALKHLPWKCFQREPPCENCGHLSGPRQDVSRTNANVDEATRPWRQPLYTGFNKALSRWARGPKDRHDTGADPEIENAATRDGAAEPLLVTPDESMVEAAGPSLGQYGAMTQSVDGPRSLTETIVTKEDKGRKRVVGVG